MATAVMFDFYGTLARWADSHISNYMAVFAAYGYELPEHELNDYFARYDGVAHAEHSVDEATYEAWVRHRLVDLTSACGVAPDRQDDIMQALRESDRGTMVAYPEAAPTLRALRTAGWAIGVCSNWGWDLDGFLDQVGLLGLIDVAVTSARAGARKPHPSIYAHALAALGVASEDVVFVGDSWEPDVEGPRRAGMRAVQVWREEERAGQMPVPGSADVRIGDLSELLGLLSTS